MFSGLFNGIAIPRAVEPHGQEARGFVRRRVAGLLNSLIAVSAMLLSSLTVIGNTVLLIRRPN